MGKFLEALGQWAIEYGGALIAGIVTGSVLAVLIMLAIRCLNLNTP